MQTKQVRKVNLVILFFRLIFLSLPLISFGLGYFINTRLYGTAPFEAIVVSAVIALCGSSLLTYSALKFPHIPRLNAKCKCCHGKTCI